MFSPAAGSATRNHDEMEFARVELHGGPLDGTVQPVPLIPGDTDPGVALIAGGCAYLGGRSWYEPDAGGVWRWVGDSP